MTPERRAEVVAFLHQEAEATASSDFAEAFREAADALEAMPCEHEEFHGACVRCGVTVPPKSAEASMKERIEGLEAALNQIRTLVMSTFAVNNAQDAAMWDFHRIAREALHGPSDPDRDRETRAEQVKP